MAEGLREILSRNEDLEIVGLATDGQKAIELTRAERPDVLVLDIDLPKENGIGVLKRLAIWGGTTRTLIFSMYSNPRYVLEAISLGVSGYALKEEPVARLVKAVREVACGGQYFSEPIQRIAAVLGVIPGPAIDLDKQLSSNEREVVLSIARGNSLEMTAACLGISKSTVRAAWAKAIAKLGLRALGQGLYTASLE